MSEEAKKRVLDTARACLGAHEGTDRHKLIINIYNQHIQGTGMYKVKYTDPWCAAFVSACFIASGVPGLIPIQASCFYMKNEASKRGMYRLKSKYTPVPGDIVLYKWKGDTIPKHVGIIEEVDKVNIKVIEGNKSDEVGRRLITKNYPYIEGYIHVTY